MNRRKISRLILKKSISYLKSSITIFLVSILLAQTLTLLLANQFLIVEKDIIENQDTRMISVGGCFDKEGEYKRLDFDDSDKIKEIINNEHAELGVDVIGKYRGGDFYDDLGNVYTINSLDMGATEFFIQEFIQEDNTLYTQEFIKDKLVLDIMKVDIADDGGLIYSDVIPFEVYNKQIDFSNNPFMVELDQLGWSTDAYVSFNTFKDLMEVTHDITWDEMQRRYEKEGFTFLITDIYVFVDDVKQVETVAKTLDDNLYTTNYLFKSFDDISRTIQITIIIVGLIFAVILISTIINVVLAFKKYLNLQQKDIGIFRHFGYKKKEVRKIYALNIHRIFLRVLIVSEIYALVMGVLFLGIENIFRFIIPLMIIVFLLLVGVNQFITKKILKEYIEKDILVLLKTSKEFQ